MGRDQVVVGDVDEQVVEQETLERGKCAGRVDALSCLGRESTDCDHDSGLVVVARHISRESLDLLNAHSVVLHEFNIDGTALGHGSRVDGGGWWGVLLNHSLGGARGEGQLGATAMRLD